MASRWIGYGAVAAVVVASLVLLGVSTGAIAPLLGDGYDPDEYDPGDDEESVHGDYEHATVSVLDDETGAELDRVEAAIADTFETRYLGLSATDELPEDRGMLFVHDRSVEHPYVMRNMSFGIDIVFVDVDGTITTIHEAPKPGPGEDGNDHEYESETPYRYVLEVNRGWTADRDVEIGDEISFER